ncbi:MAG TPA: hypothetical protein VFZ72_04975 [Jiangellaceae bacterium]
MLRVRIELPDQPGSLARVTWTLGVLGADIAQIAVLERGGGRALDDITLEWRGQPRDRLLSALRSTPGVKVLGVWTERNTAEALPEIDIVTQMVTNPRRATVTLTDAIPLVLAADWACVTDTSGAISQASVGAPPSVPLPARRPPRVVAETDDARLARAPLPADKVLTVARVEGPAFHRTELERLQRMIEVLACLQESVFTQPLTG